MPGSFQEADIARLARHAAAVLDLDHPLSAEYFYARLPLCVLDAVFSIGVRYEAVENVISRYCATAGVPRYRADRTRLPAPAEQESITSFCARLVGWGTSEAIAARLGNRQRTSSHPTSSLLNAEAVRRFAEVLRRHGIDYLQDMAVLSPEREAVVEPAIRAIPGQTSGISWSYFRMLSGTDDLVKPDRMILRFLSGALGRPVSVSEATRLIRAATDELRPRHPQLTARQVDHAIWNYQRQASPERQSQTPRMPAATAATRTRGGLDRTVR